MRSRSIVVAAATLWAITAPCLAQSFDCRAAKTPDEVTICLSADLAAMDSRLANLYFGYRGLLSGQDLHQLQADQIAFLRRRKACGADVSCIATAYQNRIEYLRQTYPAITGAKSPLGLKPQTVEATSEGQPGGTSVALLANGGAFAVPVTINGSITLNFMVDSGASDVSIPADVVMTLTRTGTLTSADFLGEQTYTLADGSTVPSQRFTIRSLKVGDKVLQNVTGSVAPVKGGLLLGQSFLSRFSSWSIDNEQHVLVLK